MVFHMQEFLLAACLQLKEKVFPFTVMFRICSLYAKDNKTGKRLWKLNHVFES